MGPRSSSASYICLPLAHKLPFSPPSFVLVLPRLPWNFSPCLFFSPHSHCSVDKGIYTHPPSLTLFLCKQTRALRAGTGELEQPVGNSLGGPASHCGARCAGPGFDPGKKSSKPKEQTSSFRAVGPGGGLAQRGEWASAFSGCTYAPELPQEGPASWSQSVTN